MCMHKHIHTYYIVVYSVGPLESKTIEKATKGTWPVLKGVSPYQEHVMQ